MIPATFLPELLNRLLQINLFYLGLWSGADFIERNFMHDIQEQMIDTFQERVDMLSEALG